MKILLIGTVEFSFKSLQKMIEIGAEVVGVCTKEKSSFNSDYSDLSPLCIENNIPFKYVNDINSEENVKWVKQLEPDIIFCFGWSSLIKKELLNIPVMGVVGFHPAELPKNRGRHPLIWALVLGLKQSASTFFFMGEGADDGDIISQEKFPIAYADDAQSLYHKVTEIALKQIETFLPQLALNTYSRVPQNAELANVWRKRGKDDGRIDFRMNSYSIYNLVRGLAKPYVGAHIEYRGKDYIVWEVEEVGSDCQNIEPGKVLKLENNTFLIQCADQSIRVLKHDFKIMPSVGEYL